MLDERSAGSESGIDLLRKSERETILRLKGEFYE